MQILNLTLRDFRGCRALDISFSSPLTLVIGGNGSGKSTILDAVAIMLSWAVARIRRSNAAGQGIDHQLDIRNDTAHTCLTLTLSDGEDYSWTMVRTRPGRKMPEVRSDYQGATRFAGLIRDRIEQAGESASLPVFAYYPVDRAVHDIPLRIRQKHSFELFERGHLALLRARGPYSQGDLYGYVQTVKRTT
jgi:predicted ATP-binding protein involved in virulence